MAKQYEQQRSGDTVDRVTDLARDIYLALVVGNDQRIASHHAVSAFEKAEAFWLVADTRKKKTEGEK